MITIILEFVAFYYAIVNKKIKEFIIINMLLINGFQIVGFLILVILFMSLTIKK